ncbi:hypothetical protein KKF84_15030 [Myxococcota bacterium]|nr:hypothetical protein [Myxococcota bacterium]MBU1536638.1 hypothetical protein [Myxococcota bacterium]
MKDNIDENQAAAKPALFDYIWRIFWLVTSLFLVVMLPYAIFVSKQDQDTLDKKGKTAMGVVTGRPCRTMSGDGERQRCSTVVKFKVPDGRVFSFTDPRNIKVAVGNTVKVKYILKGNSVYDAQIVLKSGKKVNLILWGVLGILALLFGGIAIVCIRSLYHMKKGTWKG